MKHLPNLLKQESSSASTLVTVLLRLYFDPRPAHQAIKSQVTERLLPLGMSVLQDFNKLRSDTQMKNIMAWTPVVAEIMHGFTRLDNKAVSPWICIVSMVIDWISLQVRSVHACNLPSRDGVAEQGYGSGNPLRRPGILHSSRGG